MTVNELRDFIFENYYKLGFVKGSSYYSDFKDYYKDFLLLATKLIEKKKLKYYISYSNRKKY